jgi:hypothetical protein
MGDLSRLQSAYPETRRSGSATRRPSGATDASARPRRWARIAAAAALAAGAAWVIGRAASHRIESRDIEIASRRQEPLPGFRKDPRATINGAVMGMGWVPNLDGTAVAYAAEADGLVAPDGRFRTNLSARDAARILHLDSEAIVKATSPREIDPQAILFRAQSGTLTEPGKARSRKQRREQAAQGLKPDATCGDWDVRDFAFTLERLGHPSEEERTVLSAISRSKLLARPEPGDTIRAVPVNRGDLEGGKVALWPGMLPPEVPMAPPGTRQGAL